MAIERKNTPFSGKTSTTSCVSKTYPFRSFFGRGCVASRMESDPPPPPGGFPPLGVQSLNYTNVIIKDSLSSIIKISNFRKKLKPSGNCHQLNTFVEITHDYYWRNMYYAQFVFQCTILQFVVNKLKCACENDSIV